jgi:penicillin-binding protein 2
MRRHARDTDESARRITRRALLLGGAQMAVVGVLAGGCAICRSSRPTIPRAGRGKPRQIRLIAPARGVIFDRNGMVIAENQQNYRIIMVREDAGDIDMVMRRLAAHRST